MIWFCSDWHFSHDKDFVWKARGFNSVAEMNEEIIKRHNSVVAEDDDVYVLGDLCMSGDLAANKSFIEQLNGRIHVVFGNHCTANRQKMYLECKNVVEICGYSTMVKYKKSLKSPMLYTAPPSAPALFSRNVELTTTVFCAK